ncbi:MAG: 3-methyl-2-oxobutanoate dehydrogenase subunit VorB [Rikenellaceae bacterium]|nr:3-methyl-2-oxobutanoate dehydrogenase subunit VorB [Rikenellaceae bacterium]
MNKSEVRLMKGNEVIAEAAVRAGCDAYFGYPITPQTEVIETLMEMAPWQTTGMVVLQAESELASINMVYGAAACGKKVMTSSSSPGISLMGEGLSYMAGAQLPCVVLNVQRGGPGLGTIQPSQSDYFQAVKAGGHGDFKMLVLAPNSVQEMYDHVFLAFELAFKYRNPVMILSDGVIGQMMEKVVLSPAVNRMSDQEIIEKYGTWAITGRKCRERNIVTSVQLDPHIQEGVNNILQAKYRQAEREEVRFEEIACEDAQYIIVAYGSSARISAKAVEMARQEGHRVGILRPVTLYPFPTDKICELAARVKGILTVEMSTGQMVEDVRLAVRCQTPVEFFGRYGGMIPTPGEVYQALQKMLIERKA